MKVTEAMRKRYGRYTGESMLELCGPPRYRAVYFLLLLRRPVRERKHWLGKTVGRAAFDHLDHWGLCAMGLSKPTLWLRFSWVMGTWYAFPWIQWHWQGTAK